MDDSWAQEWIEDYGAAWRARDAEALAELFAEDAVYRSSPFRPPTVGREAIRDYWREATSTQEELDLRFGAPIVHGNRVVVEWWAIMRDSGKEVTLPGSLIMRFGPGGRCLELREYWHLEEGRSEPPSGWGS
ncbi:MAG: nuclear transport factor 2 family protein [Thermoleophilaceae bacterium]